MEKLKGETVSVVVMTQGNRHQHASINDFCRSHKIKFIQASVDGVFARCFNDFGETFEVLDKNGDDTPELFIKTIENNGEVTLMQKHNLQDGDSVVLYAVQGLQKLDNPKESINGQMFKIVVKTAFSFSIGDLNHYSNYERQGLCKHVKVPEKLKFDSFK